MIITEKYLELIEEYNRMFYDLWLEPLYINVCQSYFHLLEGTEYNVSEISDTLYIKSILEKNRSSKEAKGLIHLNNPVKYIQDSLKHISEVIPSYKSYHDTGINGKEIGWDKAGFLRRSQERKINMKSTADTKTITEKNLDFDKELTKEQYESEEYQIGYANGVCSVLGLMQRMRNLGYSLDEVIEKTFQEHNDVFQIPELEKKKEGMFFSVGIMSEGKSLFERIQMLKNETEK